MKGLFINKELFKLNRYLMNTKLYLEGYLTPGITNKTNHSKDAIDRYIKDYHKVETLLTYWVTDLDQISHLEHLQKS